MPTSSSAGPSRAPATARPPRRRIVATCSWRPAGATPATCAPSWAGCRVLVLRLLGLALAAELLEIDLAEAVVAAAEVAGHLGLVVLENQLLQILGAQHAERRFGALAGAGTEEADGTLIEHLQ